MEMEAEIKEAEETQKKKEETKEREGTKEKEKDGTVPFMFNINDKGLTELSLLWEKEEMAASGREYEIWNRRYKEHLSFLITAYSTLLLFLLTLFNSTVYIFPITLHQ